MNDGPPSCIRLFLGYADARYLSPGNVGESDGQQRRKIESQTKGKDGLLPHCKKGHNINHAQLLSGGGIT